MNAETSYEKPKATNPPVLEISGTKPGVLDDTQPSRLLRTSRSTLSFASFDPYIAAPHEVGFQNLNLQGESCRPKRIVIETIPGHGSFWRWVPSARKMQDVEDEGVFPRVIDICGRYVYCSQDQWDIYKLDPRYDCFVKYSPALTEISMKDNPYPHRAASQSESEDYPTPVYDDEPDPMIVDNDPTPFNPYPPKPKTRPTRRQSPRTPHQFDFTSPFPPFTEEAKPRKRPNVSFQGLRTAEEEENEYLQEDSQNRNTKFYDPKYQKRARTLSPGAKKRSLNANRTSRQSAKQRKWEQENQARREQRERQFLREVLSEVPPPEANTNNTHRFDDIPEEDETSTEEKDCDDNPPPQATPADAPPRATPNLPPDEDDEAHRIAESRRKMAELNADRDRQRAREMSERPEETSTKRFKSEGPDYAQKKREKAEEEKRREEAQRREQEQIRLRKEEEARRLRQELLENFEREKRIRHQHWNQGMWSSVRAIERYKVISAFFDKAKFSSSESPLADIDIPWPTLRHPHVNTARDMDWESVTQFFNAVKVGLRGQAFNDFVKVSLQRFHPDRWKSRKLYPAIVDESERNEIETAVSTVSKAIGSLWAELKSS